MTKITIALLFNVRRHYPNPKDYRNQLEADFDDPETTQAQIRWLKKCGYRVIPIEANEKAYFQLVNYKREIDLALNLAEGIYGQDRESQIPGMLEMLQIPYTGCTPLVSGLMLNKAKAKDVLIARQIPTLPYQLIEDANESVDSSFKFPLIVKPVAEGSSSGITNDSVVYCKEQLNQQVKKIIDCFHQPVLVEPFLQGREFSVAMIGNPPQILPVIESDHSVLPKNYQPLDSLEVKWYFEEENKVNNLICPAHISQSFTNKLITICVNGWKALGVRDWCRVDLRCDNQGNPFILEFNSPPGVIPPEISMTSYFPLAARTAGIDYPSLLNLLIKTALKRYH